jgi:hypothetical protein
MGLALLTPLMLGVALWLMASRGLEGTGERRVRWVVALLLLPMVYSLVFSLSRQTYIGAAAMLCLVLLVYRPRLLLLAIPLFFLLMPYVIPDVVAERVSWLDDPFSNAEVGLGVYSTRVNAWRYRLPEMLRINPITGRGLASLPPGFLDSQYLINLYYTGFVGLAAFLWLLASFARQAWRLYKSAACPFGQALGLAGVGAVVGLGVAGLGGAPFVAVRAREMFWLLMAGVSAYSIQLGTGSHEREEKSLNQP